MYLGRWKNKDSFFVFNIYDIHIEAKLNVFQGLFLGAGTSNNTFSLFSKAQTQDF